MAVSGTTPSARETLSKIADELQARVRQSGVRAVEGAIAAAPVAPAPVVQPAAPMVAPPVEHLAPVAAPPPPVEPAAPFVYQPPPVMPPEPSPGVTYGYQPQPAPAAPPPVMPSPVMPQQMPPEPIMPMPSPAPVLAAEPPPPPTVIVKSGGIALAAISLLIALSSLAMSVYQSYLFHQSVDLLQRNVARGEYIRTCREVIETYFLVKQRISVLMPAADRGNIAGASRVNEANRLDAQATIAKFGALGTYLANFQDDATRARYTNLTRTLTGIMDNARNTGLQDIDKTFEPADRLFGQMNDDCIKLTRTMRM